MENPVYDNQREFYENEISRLRLKRRSRKVLAKSTSDQLHCLEICCVGCIPQYQIISFGKAFRSETKHRSNGNSLTEGRV